MANPAFSMNVQNENCALSVPSGIAAEALIADCRAMFERHLAAWASDCLTLRRAGIDELRWSARNASYGSASLAA